MMLGIDGRLANAEKRAGVGHFCAELLQALPAQLDGASLRIYLDAPPRATFPLSAEQAELRVLPPGRFWTQRILGRELRRHPPDVFFSPVTQLPVCCPCPAIAAVHDLAFFDFGAYFTFRQRQIARWQARHVARNAAHLVADSFATQRDLAQFLGVPASRVTVAHLGCSSRFRRADEAAIRELRQRHGLPEHFVLYVGRLQPRKNLVRLIEAFARLRARRPDLPHHLLMAGDEGWLQGPIYAAAEASTARAHIRFLGFVPDADLPALISAADLLALVSLWEGFGLPVLEAMACGTAVLTSNCSSLPEVADDAALMTDPYDVPAMADALERLITDEDMRLRLSQRGPVQAARFTWEHTAQSLLSVARSLHAGTVRT